MPNTVIDYVVVQSPKDAQAVANGEDPYYLYRDFYGNDTKYGSIFLDYRSTLDSKNMLLQGFAIRLSRFERKASDLLPSRQEPSARQPEYRRTQAV